MNPAKSVMERADEWQQGHRRPAFLFGVVKKFGDDQAGSLAALIAYYGFLSLFPLLLVAVTVLGYVLAGNPGLEHKLLNSALANFPVIGNQLKSNVSHPLSGSAAGLVLGVLSLVWGGMGVAQAGQYAMAQVWHVPQYERPGFLSRLLRGLAFLGLLGASAVVTTVLSAAGTFSQHIPVVAQVVGPVLSLAANVGLYLLAFRVLTPTKVLWGDLLPGAVVGGVGWFLLQIVGGYLVGHQLRHASQVYGMFGLVLGLISWIYLGAQLSLYAAEVNVVRARRLWPRSFTQPPLTPADRDVYVDLVEQERRRPEQAVDVAFEGEAAAPAGGRDEPPVRAGPPG